MTAIEDAELQNICYIIDNTVTAEQIYLFGSHAYGTANSDSDFDLCVVIPDSPTHPVDIAIKLRQALVSAQCRPLDIVVRHNSQFQKRCQGPTLERKIAREGVLLHDRQSVGQRMA